MRETAPCRASGSESAEGFVSTLVQRRFVSMDDARVAGLETAIVAEDWSGRLEVRAGIDGRVVNGGVRAIGTWPAATSCTSNGAWWTTVHSHGGRDHPVTCSRRPRRQNEGVPQHRARVRRPAGRRGARMDRARDLPGPRAGRRGDAGEGGNPVHVPGSGGLRSGFGGVDVGRSCRSLRGAPRAPATRLGRTWDRFDIGIAGSERTQLILRLHVFHLVQNRLHAIDLDVGVPARGLHGEAYRGHVFWDELFIFPLLNYRLPILGPVAPRYRHRRYRSRGGRHAHGDSRGPVPVAERATDRRRRSGST